MKCAYGSSSVLIEYGRYQLPSNGLKKVPHITHGLDGHDEVERSGGKLCHKPRSKMKWSVSASECVNLVIGIF